MGVSPFGDTTLAYDQLIIVVLGQSEDTGGYAWKETNVDVDGASENQWDKKKAGGQDGARATDKGYVLAEPKLTWLVCNDAHWREYDRLLESIRPQPGRKAKPRVMVSHPLIAQMGVVVFDVQKIPVLKFIAVDQWEASLELLEWRKAPKPTKKAADPSEEAASGFASRRSDLTNGYFIPLQKSMYAPPSMNIPSPPPKKR